MSITEQISQQDFIRPKHENLVHLGEKGPQHSWEVFIVAATRMQFVYISIQEKKKG